MKHLTIFLLAIFATYGASAGTNLLDLLKAGKAKYSTYSCQKFIQDADHTTLKSPELLKHVVKLKNFKYLDEYFFHYTNAAIVKTTLLSDVKDRGAAQRTIVQNKGYSAILEYQMTYADALSNVKGVGFYVAANPFSSASYGETQLSLKFSQNTNIIDAVAKAAEISKAIAEVNKVKPEFASCGDDLIFSLMMNENGIDIALYDYDSDWLVMFNEDVIVESKVTDIPSKGNTDIMKKIIENGDTAALIEYITEMGQTNSYKIPLATFETLIPAGQKVAGKSTLLSIAGFLKNWNDAAKVAFAKVISTKKGTELTNLMSEFKVAKLLTDDSFMQIPLTQGSDDFVANIVARIKRSPIAAKAWGALYNDNMAFLFKKSLIDLPFYLGNFPDATKRADFYKTYSSKGFSADQIISIFDYMFRTDPTYFQGLDASTKMAIFNEYIKNAKADRISAFVETIDKLGYDTAGSFNYYVRRPYSNGANGYSFLTSYIKYKKNPALLTDALVQTLISNADFNAVEFMVYLKQTPAFAATSTIFAKGSINAMKVPLLDGLLRADYALLLSKEEKDLVLKRLLQDDTEGSKLISKFISSYAYSGAALSDFMSRESTSLTSNGTSALLVIKSIESDPVEWTKFTDLSNAKGMLQILSNSKLASAKTYVLDRSSDVILRNPDSLTKIPASSLPALLASAKIRPYFSSYTEEQKLSVSLLMKTYQSATADEFIRGISYSPAMVTQNFNSLLNQARADVTDYEELLNNLSFVGPLSQSQFDSIVVKALSFRKPIDLKTLIRSDILSLDRALSLISKLERANGTTDAAEIADHQLSFDTLSDAEKKIVSQKLIYSFDNFSILSRELLWKRSIENAVALKDTKPLLWQIEKMTRSQKVEYFDYYTSTEVLLNEALATMPGGPVKFYEAVLELDSLSSLTPVLKYIETHYPVPVPYYAYMITNYTNARETADLQKAHFHTFVCKKVNKFKAFDEFIKAEQNKETKKQYKNMKKQICNDRD